MLLALNDLIAEGAFRPVIDRTYPIEQIRDAHVTLTAVGGRVVYERKAPE